MVRKGFAALSLAAMVLFLAACGGDDPADEAAVTEEPVAAETEAEASAAPVPTEEAASGAAELETAVTPDPTPVAETPPVETAPATDTPVAEEGPAPDVVVAEDGTITGIAEAVESATIRIGDTRIMLYGLESVYPPQTCTIDGQMWECWPAVVRQLQTFLAEGPVSCTPVAAPDLMGRELALCEQNGESLNARFVRSGFALAIEDEMPEYAELEAAAREEGIGLWQGQFVEPRDFRLSRGIMVRRP